LHGRSLPRLIEPETFFGIARENCIATDSELLSIERQTSAAEIHKIKTGRQSATVARGPGRLQPFFYR